MVRKASIALKEQAVAARVSAWARTIEKLRKRQMALKEQVGTECLSENILNLLNRL